MYRSEGSLSYPTGISCLASRVVTGMVAESLSKVAVRGSAVYAMPPLDHISLKICHTGRGGHTPRSILLGAYLFQLKGMQPRTLVCLQALLSEFHP